MGIAYASSASTWCQSDGATGAPGSAGVQTLAASDTGSHHVSLTLTGLTTGDSYCAAIEAVNGSGQSFGAPVPFAAGAISATCLLYTSRCV